ncbi:MAG: M23 family metallopeptidase [Candidatus Cyclobacteriaceae bacterium M3_2C_046]
MKKRRKSRKTLSNRLTNRYVLIVRNEENFAEKSTFSFSYAKLIVFVFAIFTVFLFISLYLVKSILAQWFDPRHTQLETNQKIIELSMNVDSLAESVETKDLFIQNLRRIIEGDSITPAEPQQVSNLTPEEKLASLNEDLNLNSTSAIDSQFRSEFEQYGISLVTNANIYTGELQEVVFFTPVSGIISSPYNPKIDHYGVDIVSKDNEPIKAVADGTVIFSGWTQEYGHMVVLQHRGDLLTVYKHNSELLQKVGNFVNAGDVIAIIGNTGDLTSGPHLHFEIWYNGNPVNPEEFVSF